MLLRKIFLAAISVYYAVSDSTVTSLTATGKLVNAEQYKQGLLASLVMGISLFVQILLHH